MNMTVSLRASEVKRVELDRILADIKTTGQYEGRRVLRVLTAPRLVYGRRWEFDIETDEQP